MKTPTAQEQLHTLYLRGLDAIQQRAVVVVPAWVSWWAMDRHADAAQRAGSQAHLDLRRVLTERLSELGGWERCGFTQWPPLWFDWRLIFESARDRHPFTNEPIPEPADGNGFVGIAKGCTRAPIPKGAVGRRGGGESSGVLFYAEDGHALAAYRAAQDGPSVWCVEARVEWGLKMYGATHGANHPLLPVGKTVRARAIQSVFGGY